MVDNPQATLANVIHIAILAAVLTFSAHASEESASASCERHSEERPTIGLALSGGGARGGAHIGVLKALEELRVPVDCIAGTSVGAVIGGFYASGLSVAQIEDITRGIDWNSAFQNAVPRASTSFRRKQDDYLFLVDVGPGLRAGKLALPIGLVQGQVIDMILSRALAATPAERDFDRLGISFRAVATDLSTGRPVVLGDGDLALALRASISLPALLSPTDIDGRMLIDGGLAMNLPVEVVQAMGAVVVVAVDVTSSLLARESMRSVIDVTSQLTTLITQPAMEEQKNRLHANDILLTPTFGETATFGSFAMFEETIADGYRAVMDQRERFEAWSLDRDGYAASVAEHRRPDASQLPIIRFVRLDNRSSMADSVIAARMGTIPLGLPFDSAAGRGGRGARIRS